MHSNYKKEITHDERGYHFKGYVLSTDFMMISKDSVDVLKSQCLRYGDKLAWFIAEVISLDSMKKEEQK